MISVSDKVKRFCEVLAMMNGNINLSDGDLVIPAMTRFYSHQYFLIAGEFSRPITAKRSLHWTRSSLSFMRKVPVMRKPLTKPRYYFPQQCA